MYLVEPCGSSLIYKNKTLFLASWHNKGLRNLLLLIFLREFDREIRFGIIRAGTLRTNKVLLVDLILGKAQTFTKSRNYKFVYLIGYTEEDC